MQEKKFLLLLIKVIFKMLLNPKCEVSKQHIDSCVRCLSDINVSFPDIMSVMDKKRSETTVRVEMSRKGITGEQTKLYKLGDVVSRLNIKYKK